MSGRTLTEGDAILRDIILHPEDDAPRLVYADWLEEEGHQPERAAYIRREIARHGEGIDAETPQTEELACDVYGRELFNLLFHRILPLPRRAHVERGFVWAISLPLQVFLDNATAIFRQHPVTAVSLTDRRPRVSESGLATWHSLLSHRAKPETAHELPCRLRFARAKMFNGADGTYRSHSYAREELAHEALGASALAYGQMCRGWKKEGER